MNEHNAASFRRALASIRNGLPALREIAAKRARVTSRQTGHGSRTVAPIPLNLGAWSLLQDILTLVEHMSRVLGLPMRMDAEGQLKGIIPRADRLLERADAPAIMELTSQAATRLGQQLTPPPERKMIGRCPTCTTDLWCDERDLASGWTVCARCGATLRVRDVQQASVLRSRPRARKAPQPTSANCSNHGASASSERPSMNGAGETSSCPSPCRTANPSTWSGTYGAHGPDTIRPWPIFDKPDCGR